MGGLWLDWRVKEFGDGTGTRLLDEATIDDARTDWRGVSELDYSNSKLPLHELPFTFVAIVAFLIGVIAGGCLIRWYSGSRYRIIFISKKPDGGEHHPDIEAISGNGRK